ncbi:hypothetical protein BC826DRAFT_1102890 [Russula brevipes]|nr:hypothetical protein BC826DRAFT_1102890 [Russula brevipes]
MATERDYAVELNNFLQGHPAGNLTPFFKWVMKQEGNNNDATHIATAKYRDETYGVGTARSKGAAKRIAAKQALDHFEAQGVPGTEGAQGGST